MNEAFKTILFSMGQLLVALVAEAVMRRMGHQQEANAAEGTAIASMVDLCGKVIDAMAQIPEWMRVSLKNPVMLTQLAKWTDDQVEFWLNKGMDELGFLKPDPVFGPPAQ